MTNSVESRSNKSSFVLANITYGEPLQEWNLYNGSEDTNTVLGRFLSDPRLSAEVPTNSIGLGDTKAKLTISTDPWPFPRLITRGKPFAPVSVRLFRRTIGAEESAIRAIYTGLVSKAVRNPGRKQGITQLFLESFAESIQQPAGFSCNAECQWGFGNPGTCDLENRILLEGRAEPGIIALASVTSSVVTISGLADRAFPYWHRGKIRKDGVKILIKQWIEGDQFILSKVPPPEWDGQSVEVLPGCNQSVSTCEFWNNSAMFSGIGIAAPSHNPVFENPF